MSKLKVRYPLTDQAKIVAQLLVSAWKSGEIEQTFDLIVANHQVNVGGELKWLPLSAIKELQEYKLIRVESVWITLLQELRSAVETDFVVSDFFLTTHSVGTIVYGDLIADKAIFQSAASNYGHYQNIQHFTEKLEETLGDLVKQNSELKNTLIELKASHADNRIKKAGKVIEELGRYLEHSGNTGAAITAIEMMIHFLR